MCFKHLTMSSPKKSYVIDPDYEMSEVARERVRLREELDNKEKMEKLKNVLNREFQTELDHRQAQMELIQQRLNQAQKTLHLLRYVLVTSYYNENEKITSQLEKSSEELSVSSQERLHPAVKKLLGRDANKFKLNFIKTTRHQAKRMENHKRKIKMEHSSADKGAESAIKTMSQQEPSGIVIDNDVKEEFDTARNRRKSKYCIVVGNISKWMPSESEEDKSTHKWMVYVRGTKDNPDISHFVEKVIFYLHPSYQPNDVVEIRKGPFHLARRGWGEFPLRVRISFLCPLNKPVDIIHNLKLDKTFTGRQTLGNETIVTLFLYDENYLKGEMEEDVIIKKEPYEASHTDSILENMDKCNVTMPYYEHDYCFSRVKKETEENCSTSNDPTRYSHLKEHSYFHINLSSETFQSQHHENTIQHQQSTNLIYGLTDLEESKNEVIEEVVLEDVKVNKSNLKPNFQRLITNNGIVLTVKKRKRPQESLLKKMFQKKYNKQTADFSSLEMSSLRTEDSHFVKKLKHESTENSVNLRSTNCKKYKLNFPSHKFKNVSEALPYLFKRLPLVSNLASDIDYKCMYPYAAKTIDEFSRWNIGRRLSSEWFQAKMIQKILISSYLPDAQNWTVKNIMMYARSHGYTPLANYNIFKKKSDVHDELCNGMPNGKCTPTENISRLKVPSLSDVDLVVDVVNYQSESKSIKNVNNKERLVDHDVELACSYVKQTLLDVGIILKCEDIIPGVLFNAAERMVLQASLSLAEDIIRRARANLVFKGNFREETAVIGVQEVKKALQERTEFSALLSRGHDK